MILMNSTIPVIDLFAGGGGLSEGFSRWPQNQPGAFDVKRCIEKDPAAIRTLTLRAFIHQFRNNLIPAEYYEYVMGKSEPEILARKYPEEWQEARKRCRPADLSSIPKENLNDLVGPALNQPDDWVLIGGPPCRPFSTIGRARSREQKGYNAAARPELELYREYLKVIAGYWPAVFIMENVRGLLSASQEGCPIFQKILEQLQNPIRETPDPSKWYRLYSLTSGLQYLPSSSRSEDFIVRAEDYGIPQARHRVIIFGVRADIQGEPKPLVRKGQADASQVLNGLPPLRSGLSRQDSPEGWLKAIQAIRQEPWWPRLEQSTKDSICQHLNHLVRPLHEKGGSFLAETATCEYRPDWYLDEKLPGTLQHQARSHRPDDLWRYLFAACAVKESGQAFHLSGFPESLKPNHRNLRDFSDRFSVVPERGPSRTVVSHIRKDGHYYIHYDPTQCRSLTVREAARLQTFPDNYFFEGNRTEQYNQVGNAVPPLLSYQIAEVVADLLQSHQNG